MFPDIEGHEDPEHGIDVDVVLFHLHDKGPVRQSAEGEGGPPRALDAHGRLGEDLLKTVEGAIFSVEEFRQGSRRLASATLAGRGEVFPENVMEEMTPDMEGQFLVRCLRIEVRVVGLRLVEPLKDGVGPVDVCRVSWCSVRRSFDMYGASAS